MSRALLITGATGKQGSSVINALLAKKTDFLLLAATRNKESPTAKKLASKSSNIKLIQGDLDSIPALFKAAKQAAGTVPLWGVYSVQLSMGKDVTLEGEVRQGKGLIDESIKAGIKHFVYSSVDRGGDEKSWKDATVVPHFKTKHEIEHYLRDSTADGKSPMNWTILRPTAFMENLEPGFATKVFLTMIRDTLKDKPLQWTATEDIGFFAAEAFTDPQTWGKQAISLAGDELTFAQLNEAFEHAIGGPAGTTFGLLGKALKYGVAELGTMVNWFRDEGYGADLAKVRQLNPAAKTMEQPGTSSSPHSWQPRLNSQSKMATPVGTDTEDAVSSSSHQEDNILNPAMLGTSSFPQFSKLPPELQRFVMSKLFIINRESRSVAKRFYRVHIPCRYVHMTSRREGILYFNPELDIIHIFEWWYFPELAHDVWKLDPLHVGIVNLAQQTYNGDEDDEDDDIDDDSWYTDPAPSDLSELQGAIKRLKRVIFVFRGVSDPGTRNSRDTGDREGLAWYINPSVPVKTHVPIFQTMAQDPRAMGEFLDGMNPVELVKLRDVVEDWFEHLERWDLEINPEVLYQFMVSYSEGDPVIIDREDAVAWLEAEMEAKASELSRSSKGRKNVGVAAKKILEQNATPAFGFWLSPLEALHILNDIDNAEEQIRDFTLVLRKQFNRYTPQLCLSHLPDYNPKYLSTYEY
ncbi:uncharacterized protein BKA55DRAFT_521124 [Fusarium redolens]|uniref:NmrA-like domain-containing protein n=1 Tax=Fusarium redolens TaxID=48865 RepID=A0A9P9GDI2_FUSRE|nr:uncharacterized protein BKA55DRAFT_521124 [Fusarium redolens]KAH7236798.1 hypothetical protein BKA55DRAFT_521124 [Fusarium redolens]